MASYNLEFKASAEKDLRRLPKPVLLRVMARLEKLKFDPLPKEGAKLSLAKHLYRIRVGEYRIIYEIEMAKETITVHYIRHRRQVYRDL